MTFIGRGIPAGKDVHKEGGGARTASVHRGRQSQQKSFLVAALKLC